MSVLALLGNKGGAGKTTLSINVACLLAEQHPTLLLDADLQQSSCHWSRLAELDMDLTVAEATDDLGALIRENRERFQDIVIDCPPSIHAKQTQAAMAHADVALIPVLPSPLDIWASVKIEDELARAQAVNPGLEAILVVNQLEPRTRLSHAIRVALAELSIRSAETAISRRMAYRMCILEGKSVSQLGARGREASDELTALLRETGLRQ